MNNLEIGKAIFLLIVLFLFPATTIYTTTIILLWVANIELLCYPIIITMLIDLFYLSFLGKKILPKDEGKYDPEFIKRVIINDIYNNRNK